MCIISLLDLIYQSLGELGGLDLVLQHDLRVYDARMLLLIQYTIIELHLFGGLLLHLLHWFGIKVHTSLSEHFFHLPIEVHCHLQILTRLVGHLLRLFSHSWLVTTGRLLQSCSDMLLLVHKKVHLNTS